MVGPGARKPSVGERIQSRRPLNLLQSSLFIAIVFLLFLLSFVVCEIIIINTNSDDQ